MANLILVPIHVVSNIRQLQKVQFSGNFFEDPPHDLFSVSDTVMTSVPLSVGVSVLLSSLLNFVIERAGLHRGQPAGRG